MFQEKSDELVVVAWNLSCICIENNLVIVDNINNSVRGDKALRDAEKFTGCRIVCSAAVCLLPILRYIAKLRWLSSQIVINVMEMEAEPLIKVPSGLTAMWLLSLLLIDGAESEERWSLSTSV